MPTGEARHDRRQRERAKMGDTPLTATGAGTASGRTAKTRYQKYRPSAHRRRANIERSIFSKVNTRNEIKAYIVREGLTMTKLVEKMADQYGWSASVPNLSGKLRRGSLRYHEAVELADALGYDIVWQKRKGRV